MSTTLRRRTQISCKSEKFIFRVLDKGRNNTLKWWSSIQLRTTSYFLLH